MERLTNVAARLIEEYGRTVEILRAGEGTVDPFGNTVPGPDAVYPCNALVATFTVNEGFVAAGLMDKGDLRVLVSVEGLTITPETTDKLRIGDTTLGIVQVVPHAPGDTLFFWEVQARDIL